jgi:hypothetical protein
MKRTIDEATARRLSVKADCDPRTLRKVLKKGCATSMSAKRAQAVLIEEGYLAELMNGKSAA